MRPKIFVIGFNRTGTTSLHELFLRSGIKAVHYRTLPDKRIVPIYLSANQALCRPLLTGIDDFEAYSDLGMHARRFIFEGGRLFKELHAEQRDAYFLLNTRPVEGWLRSREAHGNGRMVRNAMEVLGCKRREVFDIWRGQFNAHCAEARAYFAESGGRFLEFDITAGDPVGIRDFLSPDYEIDIAHWAKRNETVWADTQEPANRAPGPARTILKAAASLASPRARRSLDG